MKKQILAMQLLKKISSISLIIIWTLTSCETTETNPTGVYSDGIFIINSGNFFDNNGTISFLDRNNTVASTDIFLKENMRSIAGGVTDYAEVGEKGILLVDNSSDGKDVIEIVNARTFKSIASIKGEINNPRKVVSAGTNKAYITCWDSFNADYSYKQGFVAVVDLTTNLITKKIIVDPGAESIIVIGSNAYVGNVGNKKTIQVINTQTDEISETIEVGSNPSNFVLDASNKIWMTADKEIKLLNTSTKLIEKSIKAGTNNEKTPNSLSMSKDKKTLYYTYNFYDANDDYRLKGEINALNISTSTSSVFIGRSFTALGFDTKSEIIYTSLVPSYKQAGYIFRYKTSGILIDSIKVEIAPNGFYFK
jgi:hypothetical protein